ncbi:MULTISPECIES: hypothetical protein [Streptomyces]|uniref:hypothetical protein n=1 Tax=Streptomyces TaxID=1883 RepID=UPI00025CDE83|nr:MULTISPECIES: hypothetical protein [Streptomyces]AZK96093.1 hypothetical protein B7R87_21175 [Streptomyces tsukubensis]EIF92069.1 hypothetical protein [Streptomyces tsukubensis NRRL18488]MYS63770.1 hypothetical protein [Streptomyces sp. SID5473]TAI44283.1 hypothetical protein EWI31_12410 [Streptomyces tsukubensis]
MVLCAAWALFTAVRRGTGGRTALAAAILIAPLGWFFWFVRVGYRAGRWDGYFRLQERWGSTFDGGGYFHSKARFLLPAFPLLFPLARALATARPRAAYTVLGAVVLLSSAYGGYLLLVWKYSP